MPLIRILIVDDYQPFRQSVRQVCELAAGFEVIGEAENGHEAVELAHRLQPDVILMDIEMPIMDGIEATSLIVAQNPATRVIALTAAWADAGALKMLKAGAYGYLIKRDQDSNLVEAIRAVHRGEAMIDSQVTVQVLDEFRRISEQKREIKKT